MRFAAGLLNSCDGQLRNWCWSNFGPARIGRWARWIAPPDVACDIRPFGKDRESDLYHNRKARTGAVFADS